PLQQRHRRGDRPRSPVVKPPTPTATPPVAWGQTVARFPSPFSRSLSANRRLGRPKFTTGGNLPQGFYKKSTAKKVDFL
ncbi:MAG: hypothetical protein FWG68_02110, partial [Defluviitaleaceae bacterium]|nr:hypothetical protein [Defluviitaleaceae bacterium]